MKMLACVSVHWCPENCPAVRVRFWFKINVRIRAGGQFSSGVIFLEPCAFSFQNRASYLKIVLVVRYAIVNVKISIRNNNLDKVIYFLLTFLFYARIVCNVV